jgi:hypothetical protein
MIEVRHTFSMKCRRSVLFIRPPQGFDTVPLS